MSELPEIKFNEPENLSDLMRDPTRCYVPGCKEENEWLLHTRDDPMGFSDLCLPHAQFVVENSPLILTCACAFCDRARKKFLPLPEETND